MLSFEVWRNGLDGVEDIDLASYYIVNHLGGEDIDWNWGESNDVEEGKPDFSPRKILVRSHQVIYRSISVRHSRHQYGKGTVDRRRAFQELSLDEM